MSDVDKLERGWIVMTSFPDSKILNGQDLTLLAQQTGFETRFLPAQKSTRDAWELATNLGKKGVVVPVLDSKRREIIAKYDIEPVVRIEHKNISRKAPVLRRALQEVRYVPFSQGDDGTGRNRYVESAVVAYLELEIATGSRKGVYTPVANSWIDYQIIQDLVDSIKAHQDLLENNCSSNDVRAGVRNFLLDCRAISLVGGAASYYVPFGPGVSDRLKAMRQFVKGMTALMPGEKPLAYVVEVGAADMETVADIKQATTDEMAARLMKLQSEAVEFVQSGKEGGRSEKQARRFMADLLELRNQISLLKTSLSDGMNLIEHLYEPCFQAVVEAQK